MHDIASRSLFKRLWLSPSLCKVRMCYIIETMHRFTSQLCTSHISSLLATPGDESQQQEMLRQCYEANAVAWAKELYTCTWVEPTMSSSTSSPSVFDDTSNLAAASLDNNGNNGAGIDGCGALLTAAEPSIVMTPGHLQIWVILTFCLGKSYIDYNKYMTSIPMIVTDVLPSILNAEFDPSSVYSTISSGSTEDETDTTTTTTTTDRIDLLRIVLDLMAPYIQQNIIAFVRALSFGMYSSSTQATADAVD